MGERLEEVVLDKGEEGCAALGGGEAGLSEELLEAAGTAEEGGTGQLGGHGAE